MLITERFAKETAREYACRILKINIIMLELKPGSLVSENELAMEMGLSRTPVREALIELSKSKIVEIYPQKGSYISKIDYSLVEEARFLRLVLEKAIMELVCTEVDQEGLHELQENVKLQEFYLNNLAPNKLFELDNQFHYQLFVLAHKTQTYSLLDSMTAHFDRVRSMSLTTVKDIKIIEDHNQILRAIENHDPEEGVRLITKHLSRYKLDEEELRHLYPNYFVD